MNLNPLLNHMHQDLFQSTDRELVVYGGAGAGKSYSIADKLLFSSVINSGRDTRAVIARRTLASLRKTSLYILQKRAHEFGLKMTVNKSEWTAQVNRMQFILTGLNTQDDVQKVKSLTDIDYIWVNEATEIREEDYKQLLLRLRGPRLDGPYDYRQMITDFNPVGKTAWIYERMFQKNVGNARKIRYTVLDNPWAEPEYVEQLKATKEDDPNFYKIYFQGEWGELEGVIFSWPVVPLPAIVFDEVFYGLDFGYSVNPAAVVRIYRKADHFWVEEVIYEKELTNQQLAKRMIEEGVSLDDEIYCDSAEPKSIQELCDAGFNAWPCEKGPDSVRAGIDFLKSLDISTVDGSENVVKEQKGFVWKKDKDGKALNVPIKFGDHAMSGVRYGIYTHMRRAGAALGTVQHDIYPEM